MEEIWAEPNYPISVASTEIYEWFNISNGWFNAPMMLVLRCKCSCGISLDCLWRLCDRKDVLYLPSFEIDAIKHHSACWIIRTDFRIFFFLMSVIIYLLIIFKASNIVYLNQSQRTVWFNLKYRNLKYRTAELNCKPRSSMLWIITKFFIKAH